MSIKDPLDELLASATGVTGEELDRIAMARFQYQLMKRQSVKVAEAVAAEREACAMLHEQIDLDLDAMAAVIQYRDKIRARQEAP